MDKNRGVEIEKKEREKVWEKTFQDVEKRKNPDENFGWCNRMEDIELGKSMPEMGWQDCKIIFYKKFTKKDLGGWGL